jgi:uncharacterized membrane protein
MPFQVAAAAFLASFVEFVEALTVILALGAARGWRAPLAGTAGALAVLAVVGAVFGPAVAQLELGWLRLVVGLLVLLFGLRWLRKAILRAVGVIPLHDEAVAYDRALARYAGVAQGWDWTGFAGAFQVTMLEGSEVAFIVVAVGGGGAGLAPAGAGALLALAAVVVLGLVLHRPLTRIPENALKCAVGVLLAAFGTFWTGEGVGAAWPGGDWSLPLITLVWAAVTLLLIGTARKAA